MKTQLFYTLLLSASLISCKEGEKTDTREMTKAYWLIGTWENKSQNGELTERWEKQNDSVYNGESFFIKGKDTIHSEQIVLSETDGKVKYSPKVKGQNDDKPVDFTMTTVTDKQLVFENQSHDFPQKITYTKITNDSLVAEISGNHQGRPMSEKYPMKRK